VIGAVADVASGYAAFSMLPPNSTNVTVEVKLSLLTPSTGERLIGRGIVIKAGRRLTVCRSDIFTISEGAESVFAFSNKPAARTGRPLVRCRIGVSGGWLCCATCCIKEKRCDPPASS
jgi:acyl-coenzyme A thioesterase PaaI-like protein